MRYSDLQHQLKGISTRMLSRDLRMLEVAGIVERIPYPQAPIRVEYRLTPAGLALCPIVTNLGMWAEGMVTHSANSNSPISLPAE